MRPGCGFNKLHLWADNPGMYDAWDILPNYKDAEIPLTAQVTGPAELAGFGTANPITDEDYTDNETVTYRGRALAIIRPGTEAGEVLLTVSGKGLPESAATLRCVPEEE